MSNFFFTKATAFFPAHVPDIRHGNNVEIQFFMMVYKGRKQGLAKPVGVTYNAHLHPVVGTYDAAITFGADAQRTNVNTGGR